MTRRRHGIAGESSPKTKRHGDISKRLSDPTPDLENRSPDACQKPYNEITQIARALGLDFRRRAALFSLRKAGYPPGKLSDEFPERNKPAVKNPWGAMATPVDYDTKHEWKLVEDQRLRHYQREGNSWSSNGQLLPSHSAGECLIRYLELHGSLPHPCPLNSATPRVPEENLILMSMCNK